MNLPGPSQPTSSVNLDQESTSESELEVDTIMDEVFGQYPVSSDDENDLPEVNDAMETDQECSSNL